MKRPFVNSKDDPVQGIDDDGNDDINVKDRAVHHCQEKL